MCAFVASLVTQKESGFRTLIVMVNCCRCRPNVELTPACERDLCDIEVAELRRQVQELQKRLELYMFFDHGDIHHDLNGGFSYYNREKEICQELVWPFSSLESTVETRID